MSTCSHTANRSGPTTSGPVEDAFVAEMRRRFRRLRGRIRRKVGYEVDALRLTDDNTPLLANADDDRFEFTTQPELVNKFIRWVQGAINEELLEPPDTGDSLENHWVSQYLRDAYVNGFNQGTGLLFQRGQSVDNPPNSEILADRVSGRALQTLYTRAFENLQDITEDIADTLRDELSEGLVRGENPKAMARRLTNEVRDIQRSRAETLARTETMNAHTEATLDRYERAGINLVVHEWKTASDTRVCPFCARLDGLKLTTSEMRNGAVSWAVNENRKAQTWRLAPPAHPNCRCTILPVVGGTAPTEPLGLRVQETFGNEADVLQ